MRKLLPLGALLVACVPPFFVDSYYQNMLIMVFLLAIMAGGWNVMGGYTGYISLGHSAFLGVGAYTTGILANAWGVSPFLTAPLGGVAAGVLAALLGLVTARARGTVFIIVTFALLALLGIVAVNWSSLTNGSHGLVLAIPTWDAAYANWPFYYALLGLLALTVLMSWAIRRSRFGIGLLAIRDDEEKAAGLGINTPRHKLLAFVVSSVPIGVAGGIYGYYLSFLDPRAMFTIVASITLVLAALLGGAGTLWGPVIGALLVEPFSQWTNQQFTGPDAGAWRLVLFGGVLLLVVLFLPHGILPEIQKRLKRTPATAPVGKRLDHLPVARPSGPRTFGPALLEVTGLHKGFGGLRVLDGCSFDVKRGSITGLIGPNGSGKTTVFNLVHGLLRADSGTISRPPRLARTYQLTRLFPRLTVRENLLAGARRPEKAMELLEFIGLADYADKLADSLSYGQQKLVELAQVLMLDPDLVLLDEPAGGINPTQIEQMAGLIRQLNSSGTTFLIVEHNMPLVLSLCDEVHVLANGHRIASGTPQEIQRDPLVLDAYLGADFRELHGTNS
ncbi:branched-chain amino acid ABC transporter ATP-binding protein/permease [Lentzea sp. BCCO 10_0856]|uniref:Branched-chain amino acid ABC transporter ATP-binding protein/permease n=1 Tax=Lentzea miocenica TaxID=3095431 RepID=A0ABU4T382_9PSEU|nr:branched-chain amino acid ABC transporter ATP-binding protein/permease [Lentzea sp. BCCO 10_0856]MDX8032628.1 branched-chain amino acid ABC transporter ATP-binding protein/permease [Lentzea sp. BCCO 10_0856]